MVKARHINWRVLPLSRLGTYHLCCSYCNFAGIDRVLASYLIIYCFNEQSNMIYTTKLRQTISMTFVLIKFQNVLYCLFIYSSLSVGCSAFVFTHSLAHSFPHILTSKTEKFKNCGVCLPSLQEDFVCF